MQVPHLQDFARFETQLSPTDMIFPSKRLYFNKNAVSEKSQIEQTLFLIRTIEALLYVK